MKKTKILIVGSPGSGKTTLAKKLSEKLKIPHFDLDDIRFHNKSKRSDIEAIPMVGELTRKPSWIIEGVYILWVEPYFAKADKIIFLDTPFLVSLFRIILRYFKNILRGHFRHSFVSTVILVKNLILFHFVLKGAHVTREQTKKALIPYKSRVEVLP